MLLSGKPVAEKIGVSTKELIAQHQLTPGLGVILVGDDAPSHLYVGLKEKRAQEIGCRFVKKTFASDVSEEEVVEAINELNARSEIHGIIVQLPLPGHLDPDRIISAIHPHKDTDGFHPETVREFLKGDSERLPVFPRAMLELVRSVKQPRGKAVALVNSDLLGRVLQKALETEGLASEYILRPAIPDSSESLREADVILSAIGEPRIFSALECQAGAIVIDGGISYDRTGQVVGDITRDDGVYREDIWVSAVPGGVGPVTVAVLLARVAEAALRDASRVDKK